MSAERTPTVLGPGLDRWSGMADSWLFAKGLSSVRILRTGALSVSICGPGRVRRFLSFLSETELMAFLRDTEYALTSAGFRSRGSVADRRQVTERRVTVRGPERRSPAP